MGLLAPIIPGSLGGNHGICERGAFCGIGCRKGRWWGLRWRNPATGPRFIRTATGCGHRYRHSQRQDKAASDLLKAILDQQRMHSHHFPSAASRPIIRFTDKNDALVDEIPTTICFFVIASATYDPAVIH